jgi:hypothetical protein
MRRLILLGVSLWALMLALVACHETGDDSATAQGDTSCSAANVKSKEGETVDLGCIKVTIVKSDFSSSQLSVTVLVENKSDKTLTLKPAYFSVTDSSNTNALPTTCGGKGGFSGELTNGQKQENDICWFLVGGTPPITVSFSVPGSGTAAFELAQK